jgi:hypothetical protein
VKVEKGVFNILLGSVNLIPDSVFDGSIRYLGVKVGADPEITPRKPMVSVAYAYRAGAASDNDWAFPQSAGGTNPRSYLYTYGPWGIARYGNALFGNADSTHVNLGVACTTGTSGQNYEYCTVGGGLRNTASGYAATVGGGDDNTASSWNAAVGGGQSNIASGSHATVGGGFSNTASNPFATVGGGYWNNASGDSSTIGGGVWNIANAPYTMVGGGSHNTASGSFATVGGGWYNTASGYQATVGGGHSNTARGGAATIGGGASNDADTLFTTVGGGYVNTASGIFATVGGGHSNTASGEHTTVGGGADNTADTAFATVGGGYLNTASGIFATVAGGYTNITGGDYSAIPGGYYDTLTADADYSMAFGYKVYINNSYRVIFFDGTNNGRLGINRDDHDGGISYPIHVGTNTGNGNGAYLTAGGVWTNGSSRTFKENFQPLNSQELLEKISSLPVEAWNFKNSEERHIGPLAEEFVSAFDVGAVREDGTRDDKYLSTEDIAGVALAGVKELIRENQEQKQENQELKRTIEKLSQKIAQLEKTR